MNLRVTIKDDVAVVNDLDSFDAPEVHLSVSAGEGSVCDQCSLQSKCESLFGERGKNCKEYPRHRRWHRMSESQLRAFRGFG